MRQYGAQTSTKRGIQDPGSQAQSLKYMVCQAHLARNHASEYYQTLFQLDLTEIIGLNTLNKAFSTTKQTHYIVWTSSN